MITGKRGVGKSTLVRQLSEQIKSGKSLSPVWVDFRSVSTNAELILRMAREAVSDLDSSQVKAVKDLSHAFTQLRPMIRYDNWSGKPVIDFSLDADYNSELCVDQILTYLSRTANGRLIVWDEIQQMGRLNNPALAKILSDAVRLHSKLNFVFITENGNAWKILEKAGYFHYEDHTSFRLEVEPFEEEILTNYIVGNFEAFRRKLNPSVAERIVDWCRQDTASITQVCHRLFESGSVAPDEWFVEGIFQELLKSNRSFYYTYRDLVTSNQWILLRGIAREKGARQVMGADFIRKNELGTPSSVQTALAALQDKELVYEHDGKWWLSDIVFSRWLEEMG